MNGPTCTARRPGLDPGAGDSGGGETGSLLPRVQPCAVSPGPARGTEGTGRRERGSPETRAALTGAVRPLSRPVPLDCVRLNDAVLRGDLAAATRLRGPRTPSRRCAAPSGVTVIARAQVERASRQVEGWRRPGPGQVADLWSRLAWMSGYQRMVRTPIADARLGARLAALVSYGRRCPAPASRVLEAQLHAAHPTSGGSRSSASTTRP